jgi:hypothetical protein
MHFIASILWALALFASFISGFARGKSYASETDERDGEIVFAVFAALLAASAFVLQVLV